MGKYDGLDNYGNMKSKYLESIHQMSDDDLFDECYDMIYHSARCSNNPKADWHWRVDACFEEAMRRDEVGAIYEKAYKRCFRDHVGH